MIWLNFSDDQQNREGNKMSQENAEGNQKSQTTFGDGDNLPASVNTDDGNCVDNTQTSKNLQILTFHMRNVI